MKKQFVAVGVAAVLALLGVTALISYARNADDRAANGAKLVSVLRMTANTPAKTAVSDLSSSVETAKIPKSAVIPGALTSLDSVAGEISIAEAVEGDQLSSAKFASPAKIKSASALPKGMQALAVPLTGARLVDGAVSVGDKVGVFISYSPGTTANPINNLLVIRVATGVSGSGANATNTTVTFAVKTLDAEKIIHGMEFGKVWLSKQNIDTDTSGGKTITQKDVTP